MVEELGHDYKHFLKRAKSSSGENDLLMNVAISQIRSLQTYQGPLQSRAIESLPATNDDTMCREFESHAS
ncbi:hypothetical protein FE257_006008 [Aspergillus nanangensis]|uniref:Uncharacterized protein n=1 Tax=Aspergillus nanangensis TaxID=2582783 RepID=A0AAD4CRD6_ASPNN|nr:hypothetical protein FE257_006008 [Aspergillus nanangensis]